MAGTTSITEGNLEDFPIPIIPKIGVEPNIESLIELYWLISGNVAFVALKLGGGCNEHITLTMTD